MNSAAFFFNNGEFDLEFDQGYVKTLGYDGMMYTLDLGKMTAPVGSMFGEGSLAMIVAILSLVASGVSIFLFVDMKKKLVPVATNNAKETDDEE